MSYYAKPNYINYDEWFDDNIDPLDLIDYVNESEFSTSVHKKFYEISLNNLIIGSSNNFY